MSNPLKIKSSNKSKFDFSEYEALDFTNNPPIDNLQIKKARCDQYIPAKAEKKDDGKEAKETCCCGRVLRDHDAIVITQYNTDGVKEGEIWSVKTCVVENGPTDAFGEVRFINNNDNSAKYIRVHYETPMDVMDKLLTSIWKLKEPKLLISVTGGAKYFSMKPRLQEVFRRGLVKAASSTSAWISTGGFNVGVMKHVGEAIRENASTLNPKEKIVVLGIGTWDVVAHKRDLTRGPQPKDDKPIDYSLKPDKINPRSQPLDPNHTHFILVDNALLKHGGEIDFRARLEASISKTKPNMPNEVPIVVLVLEGGPGTLRTVLESVKNETPCVFIEGSGKCADIFAYAIKNMKKDKPKEVKDLKIKPLKDSPDEKFEHEVKEKLRKKYPNWSDSDYDRMYKLKLNAREKIDAKLRNEIKERIKREWKVDDADDSYYEIEITLGAFDQDLLSVFSLDAGDKAYDIDVAILNALLRAKKNYIQQLKLAMAWNRVDMARDYIFNQDIKPESQDLDEIMYRAVMDDRVDFVKLLLQNGFNLKLFLTNRCLLKLYNDAFNSRKNKAASYLSLMKAQGKFTDRKDKNFDFKQIGQIIQVLIEDLYEPRFTKGDYTKINLNSCLAETNDFGKIHAHLQKQINGVTQNIHSDLDLDERSESPEHDLFVFSVLLLRPAMAKVFWREGSNELFVALLATKIFKILANISDEDHDELMAYAEEFEEIAKNVLDDCYKTDEEKSQLLLLRQIPEFGMLTCLQVAVSASDLVFVSHPAVQGLLTKLWYNKIVPDTTRLSLFGSVALPFLAPLLITFREDRTQRQSAPPSQSKLKSSSDRFDVLEKASTTNNKNTNVTHLINSNEIDFMDSGKKLSVGDKIFFFIKAPIIKFIYSQIFYALFVMLFSYVMLCDFYQIQNDCPTQADLTTLAYVNLTSTPSIIKTTTPFSAVDSLTHLGIAISIPEVLLIIWVTLYAIDEIRQFMEIDVKVFRARFRIFFFNIWNCLEFLALILYYVGLILRFIPCGYNVYMAARVIMCIDLILWYLKCLSFYTVVKNLGPKLVMINRMLYELMYFIFIVIVFMFGFGVSTQALMYPNQALDTQLLKNVFFPSYFIIGGEYYTRDKIMSVDTCEQPSDTLIGFDRYTQDDCPNKIGAQVSLAIYVIYLIILNILLVNLLIAIFSNTFDEVQTETDKIWKFQRYSLIYEYFHKPILAPPFSMLSYFISLLRIVLRPIRQKWFKDLGPGEKTVFKRLFVYLSKDWKTGFIMEFDDLERGWLTKWEDIISDAYLHQQDLSSKESTDYKLQGALDQIEVLSRKFDEIIDTRDNLKNQIEKCDEKIDRIWQLLSAHFGNGDHDTNNRNVVAVRPLANENRDREAIVSPSNVKNLTAVEENYQIMNEKSRTPHYPKSNVTRTKVSDDKVLWSVQWPAYHPVEYTSKAVLANPMADNNILAYPAIVRPELDYNKLDERYRVDRRSCRGVYLVVDGLPLNPFGRTGLFGRGSLNFWGPNHAIEAVITRWKKDEAGNFVLKAKGSRVLQFLILEKSIHLKQWHLPHVLLEHTDRIESTLMNTLLPQVFTDEVIGDNIGKLKNLLNKGEKIDEYYRDCQRNTDNAWIETSVVNYHDENGTTLSSKLPLKDIPDEVNPSWKDFDKRIENENNEDWNCLKLVAQRRQAAFDY